MTMKVEQFEEVKRIIVKAMLKDKAHCLDSVYCVKQCTGLKDFVDTLNKFISELKNKRFPTAEIVREYFLDNLEELNELGVYIDQEVNIRNQENVWLFGKCTGTISSDRIKFFNIVVNDDAEVTINALPYTLQKIYIKSQDAIVKFNKAKTATQLINRLKK